MQPLLCHLLESHCGGGVQAAGLAAEFGESFAGECPVGSPQGSPNLLTADLEYRIVNATIAAVETFADPMQGNLLFRGGSWRRVTGRRRRVAEKRFSLNAGEVAERLKATVLKTVRRASVSGVRIPPSPPVFAGSFGDSED
jgi:hypothetical protein